MKKLTIELIIYKARYVYSKNESCSLGYGAKDVRIEEVDVPEVKPHQVKIAVKFTGICGTDLHEYLDGPNFIPTETEHVYSGQKAPVTLGYEFAGGNC
mgnify:CR=1 FL=1